MSDANPQSPSPASSAADQVAAALRAGIWQGQLSGGQPLRQDEIAARFGVSKIPVREALFQLKAEGLVTFSPNRGAVVAQLSPAEVDELYTMRTALELAVLQRAIPHLTIAGLAQAGEVLAELDQDHNRARWGELNWEFHQLLYRPAGMPRLLETVKTLHFNVGRYLALYLAHMDFQAQSQAEHRRLLEACRGGDIPLAAGILQEHLQSACARLISFLTTRENQRREEHGR